MKLARDSDANGDGLRCALEVKDVHDFELGYTGENAAWSCGMSKEYASSAWLRRVIGYITSTVDAMQLGAAR